MKIHAGHIIYVEIFLIYLRNVSIQRFFLLNLKETKGVLEFIALH